VAKILIVDDDESLLNLMGDSLESVGLEYDMAGSAEQARNRLKGSGYDMIVSDLEMQGESGLDLLRCVSSKYPETRFILMAGYYDPRIKRESVKMGAHAYIQKPFYMNELAQTIIDLMRSDDQKEVPGAESSFLI
jgi:two-component system response regulator HydG